LVRSYREQRRGSGRVNLAFQVGGDFGEFGQGDFEVFYNGAHGNGDVDVSPKGERLGSGESIEHPSLLQVGSD
jgi:hypothetical protein